MNGADTLHASAVAIQGRGVLIRGASGSGKSMLALALIARGAMLVSDDYTELRGGQPPRMSPPEPLAGLIEARSVGLISLPWLREAPLTLVVDLDLAPSGRLPHRDVARLHGSVVPLIMGKGCPGLADTICVLVRDGRLIDPETVGRGRRSGE